MIKRTLKKDVVMKEDYQIWNAFIDLIATENEDELTDIQKHAQRAFIYDSEIQNGGHLQYFENVRCDSYDTVIDSLKKVGAKEHAKILEKASKLFLSKRRKSITNIFAFLKKEKEGEFVAFDEEYYNLQNDMNAYLKKYLDRNQNEFIEIVE